MHNYQIRHANGNHDLVRIGEDYGVFATYTTISSTPETPKSRAVFVLEEPITDSGRYRKAREAFLHRYPQSDQAIKDVARFLYGSHPYTGEAVLV